MSDQAPMTASDWLDIADDIDAITKRLNEHRHDNRIASQKTACQVNLNKTACQVNLNSAARNACEAAQKLAYEEMVANRRKTAAIDATPARNGDK